MCKGNISSACRNLGSCGRGRQLLLYLIVFFHIYECKSWKLFATSMSYDTMSDGVKTVYNAEEHKKENVDTTAEEKIEKIKLANYLYDRFSIS